MASIYEYCVWQDSSNTHNSLPVDNSSNPPTTDSDDILDIHLHFHHLLEIHYPEYASIPLTTTRISYPLPRNLFLSQDSGSVVVDALLSTTGVSRDFIDSVIPDVSSFAFDMVTHPYNSKVRVLTMGLAIFVVTPYDDRQEIDRALSEAMQENPRFEPSSKSCIEGLKRVKLVNDSTTMMKRCAICLKKQMIGQEVFDVLLVIDQL
ncbi:hypothetical protein GH714_023516 [Hevea brasiliensis]|uniref:Uncharacterized protein n=1 Tax=Hevea brasiliensis TaxID=3981 RepID=A0A6A6KRZ2_HEVBR|nr:hypothetical protein GH714_023516 [Hevea brasiliensis]